MQLSDDLFTMFSAEIEVRDGTPVVTIPERELGVGELAVGDTYRIAVLPGSDSRSASGGGATDRETDRETNRGTSRESTRGQLGPRGSAGPPVEVGETREVEIEDVGDQGDGIARIGPGYVVFVPGTDLGDRVTVSITQARENFAFAEVIEDEPISG